MRKVLNIFLFLMITCSVFGQDDVSFTASAPKVVAVGEQFHLKFVVNAKGSGFKMPDLGDFNVLAGPHTSSSSSIQIINGQMSQNVTYTFTCILQAVKEGNYTVSEAVVTVKGKQYKSNTLNIEVVKGNLPVPEHKQQQKNEQAGNVSNEDLFVRVIADKTNVYQGEHIIVTIKVYTRLDLMGFNNMKFPSYDGFYAQEIETPSQVSLHRENVGGQIYNVGLMKKSILFPQRSGVITVEPFELDCAVRKRIKRRSHSIFDDFFGSYQRVNKKVKSTPVKITVKPLPPNKPESFNGAVGNFDMKAVIDKTDVKTNDAVTLKVKISGNGNVKLIDPLNIDFPPDFETYDPEIAANVKNSVSGSSGSKVFEYLIIPRHAGKFRIAPLVFSYFDTRLKKYKTISSDEFIINVTKGDETETTNVISGFGKEDVKFIGSDIHFIKKNDFKLARIGTTLFGSVNFYLTYSASLLAFLVIFVLRRNQIKRNSNIMLVKHRKANKISRKRLRTAYMHLKQNNKEEFYDELLKALWLYLGDKLGIQVASLSKDNVKEMLEKQNIDKELINDFERITDMCQFARYAPADEAQQMETAYSDAGKIIGRFERSLR